MNSPKKLVMPEMANTLRYTKALSILLTKTKQRQLSGLEAKWHSMTWIHVAKLSHLQNQIGSVHNPQW